MTKLLAIVGPTASGKTALAAALARALNGEVVSADSMQIYRELRIGTARPTEDEMQGVPHHMLGFLDPAEEYSAARYAEDARRVVEDIRRRGKLPIVAGGTGMYLDALLGRIAFEEQPKDAALREALNAQGQDDPEGLHAALAAVDPESAARLPAGDVRRVARALEIYRLTGETMTEMNRRVHERPLAYTPCILGLCPEPREALYARIDRRVDAMLDGGLEAEARTVWARAKAGRLSHTACQAIGYKELFPWFEGTCSREEAVETLKRDTRRYAKRQLTWFRRDPEIRWISCPADVNLSLILRNATDFVAECAIIEQYI